MGSSIVAVTGGTGFVGKRLVERLVSEGYVVRVLSRDGTSAGIGNVNVFTGDLLDPNTDISAFLDGADAIFNCAGELRNESRMRALNVDAVDRLIREVRGRHIHFIQLSTVGVYGMSSDGVITEEMPMAPENAYEMSKATADNMLMSVPEGDDLKWTIIRPANIFGEGMTSRGLLWIADAVQTGFYRIVGNGEANAHYIHVDNVIDALMLAFKDPRSHGRIYNLSDTNHINSCVRIMSDFYGRPLPNFSVPEWLARSVLYLLSLVPILPIKHSLVKVLLNKTSYSRSKIENEIGYRLRIPIDLGLRKFLYWKENTSNSITSRQQPEIQGIPVVWVLWISFFCFSTFAALLFQKLVLPSMGELHAGHGLLTNDAIRFHEIAVRLAEQMRIDGLSAWKIWPMPTGAGNIAVLGFLYYLWGDDPSLVIPINAALHASGGVLLFLIGRMLVPEKIGRISAIFVAILFVGYPSALNWYGQVHKDGYAILGLLMLIYGWMRWADCKRESSQKIVFLVMTIVGVGLIVLVRPYILQILPLLLLILYMLFIFFNPRTKGRSKLFVWTFVIGILPIVISAYVFQSSYSKERITLSKASEVRLSNIRKNSDIDCPSSASWNWNSADWIPSLLESSIKNISVMRMSAACSSYKARTTIDRDIVPNSVYEFLVYLPRALQIGLFAPFPNTWLDNISVMRLSVNIEVAIWYLLAPGVLFLIFRRMTLTNSLVLFFALSFLLIYSYATPNVGTLHRVRYPFVFLLMALGSAGWVLWIADRSIIKWFSKIRTYAPIADKNYNASASIKASSSDGARSQVAQAGLVVSGLTALSFIMLFVRDVLMSQEFGIGYELDAFYIAMLIPMFLVNVVSIPLGAAFIPRYQEAMHSRGSMAGQHVVSAFSFVAIIGASLLAILFYLSGRWVLILAGWGFDGVQLEKAYEIIPYGALIIAFSAAVVLSNSILNAHGRFLLPSLAQLVVPVVAIVMLLVLAASIGIQSVAFGMVVGQILNLVIVAREVKSEGVKFSPVWHDAFAEIKASLPLISALVASALFVNAATIIDSAMASTLGVGSVGAYTLGIKIVLFMTGILGVGIATVLLPHFSDIVARRRHIQGQQDLVYFLRAATVVCAPIGIVVFMYAEPISSLLFLGGRVGNQDVGVVSAVAALGVIQLPYFASLLILIKYANAQQQVGMVFFTALVGLIVNIVLNVLLMGPMGVAGLALATSLAQFVVAGLLLALMTVRRHVDIVSMVMLTLLWLLYLTLILCLYYDSFAGVVVATIAIGFLLLHEKLDSLKSIKPVLS